MCYEPLKSASELNIEHYEVLWAPTWYQQCHKEHHQRITNACTRTPTKTFSETIDDKKQIKGSNARLYGINLAKFISTKHEEGNIEDTF